MTKPISSVIKMPMQPTYHQININVHAYMITHEANPKANANPNTWRMLRAGGGNIWFPCEVRGIPKRRKMSQSISEGPSL